MSKELPVLTSSLAVIFMKKRDKEKKLNLLHIRAALTRLLFVLGDVTCSLTINCQRGNLEMAYRTRRLTGPGHLSGDGFDGQVHYALLHRLEDVPTPNQNAPASICIMETVTGRVEVRAGLSLPPGITMVLTLHDGNKLKVITEADGKVIGIGTFFR